jgi:hypothetical protein
MAEHCDANSAFMIGSLVWGRAQLYGLSAVVGIYVLGLWHGGGTGASIIVIN